MQVYKTFFKIIKKQIGSCMIFFVIFMGLLIGLSKMGGEQRHDYTEYSCKLAIFDSDHTDASEKLTSYLSDINEIVELEDDDETIQNFLYYQEVDYVLYIEKGYAQTGELTNIKRPGSNSGMYVDQQISGYENSMAALMAAGYTIDEAYDISRDALSGDDLVTMWGTGKAGKPETYYFFLYLPYVFIMMAFSGIGPVLVEFNRREVSDRVNVSSMPVRSRNLQLAMGTIVSGIGLWLLFMLLSVIMYGSKVFEDGMVYDMLNSLTFTVVALGIVSIAGNFNLSQQKISMVSNIVGLGLSFLGGVFVPMEIFGDGLKMASRFLPTYWYVRAHEKIMSGADSSQILPCVGIQLLFGLVFIAVGMLISKRMKLARIS